MSWNEREQRERRGVGVGLGRFKTPGSRESIPLESFMPRNLEENSHLLMGVDSKLILIPTALGASAGGKRPFAGAFG